VFNSEAPAVTLKRQKSTKGESSANLQLLLGEIYQNRMELDKSIYSADIWFFWNSIRPIRMVLRGNLI
jgi:hypothetical protein